MGYRAILDANVLVPARVRDILLTLADGGLYQPHWSALLLDEMARHLPKSMEADDRTSLGRQMDIAFPDASIQLPGVMDIRVAKHINDKDRHVISAAVVVGADVVVTQDMRLSNEIDRLAGGPEPLPLEAQRPDTFAGLAIDVDPSTATSALIVMGRRWLGPQESGASDGQVLERLIAWCERQSWTTTAYQLRRPEVLINLHHLEDRSRPSS